MQEAVKASNIVEEAWLDNYVGIASRAMRFAEKLCEECGVVVANIQNPNEQTYAAVEAMQLPIAAEMMGIFDAFKKISVKQSIVNSKECLGIVILAIISETTQHLDSARTKKQFSYPPSAPYETLTGVLRERGGSAVDDLARLMPTGFSDLCTYLPAVRHYIPDADKKDEVS